MKNQAGGGSCESVPGDPEQCLWTLAPVVSLLCPSPSQKPWATGALGRTPSPTQRPAEGGPPWMQEGRREVVILL